MKRRLRIAVSVFFALVAVGLIVMWVRSYWHWDQLYNPVSNKGLIVIESAFGQVLLKQTTRPPGSPWVWHLTKEINGENWDAGYGDWTATNQRRGVGGFAMYSTRLASIVRVPYWFLVILFAAFATISWGQMPARFSLRTMLFATTLVAGMLGLAVWAGR
jgi:hypothetical protein